MAVSKSQLWSQLTKAIKVIDELWKAGATNAGANTVDLLFSLETDYQGNHISSTSSLFRSFRMSLESIVSMSAILQPLIIELAKIGYKSNSEEIDNALDDIYKEMDILSETVKARDGTFGAMVAGGSNIGTGKLYRNTVDYVGTDIETGRPGIVKGTIISDKNTDKLFGTEGMTLQGFGKTPIDHLDLGDAPGGSLYLTGTRAQDPDILVNADFDTHSGTGGIDIEFEGWDLSDATKISNDDTIKFRDAQSLEFLDNANIEQHIGTIGTILPEKPLFFITRFYKKSNCDGILTIRLGTQTENIDLSTVPNATWTDIVLGIDDQKGYYENWIEDDSGDGARVNISLASRTTGTLLIGEVVLDNPLQYNGLYYLLVAGRDDFLKDDYFTFTDSFVETGRIQFTLARLFGKNLPHTTGAPTYPDA